MLHPASMTFSTMAVSMLLNSQSWPAGGTRPTPWASSAAMVAIAMLDAGPAAATQIMSRRGLRRLAKRTGTGLA